jgi:hypothetical protein
MPPTRNVVCAEYRSTSEVLRRVRGRRGGVPVPVRGVKQRTVLALLALHRGKPVSADRLGEITQRPPVHPRGAGADRQDQHHVAQVELVLQRGSRQRQPADRCAVVMWIFTVTSLRCSRSARSAVAPVSCLSASAAAPSERVLGRSPRSGSGNRWASRGSSVKGRDRAHRGGTHGIDVIAGGEPL